MFFLFLVRTILGVRRGGGGGGVNIIFKDVLDGFFIR
jgi:hypothetical protein